MTIDQPLILLYRGHSFHDTLIRWQTWSHVAHASMIFPSGCLYEAVWPRVAKRKYDPTIDGQAEKYFIPKFKPNVWSMAEDFIAAQVGKRYNWRGLVRFLVRDGGDTPNTWFCSDLVFRTVQYAGLDLLARTPYWKVSPERLRSSLLIIPNV